METNRAMAAGRPQGWLPACATAHAAEPQGAARRVLVVDDNRDAAASLALMLELDQHHTHLAYSGPEAIDAVASFRPDVVLLDLGLPGLNGYEVACRIRARAGGSELLLVALTGWGGEDYRQMALAAGFDAHMAKPTDLAALARLLRAPAPPLASGLRPVGDGATTRRESFHDPCIDRR